MAAPLKTVKVKETCTTKINGEDVQVQVGEELRLLNKKGRFWEVCRVGNYDSMLIRADNLKEVNQDDGCNTGTNVLHGEKIEKDAQDKEVNSEKIKKSTEHTKLSVKIVDPVNEIKNAIKGSEISENVAAAVIEKIQVLKIDADPVNEKLDEVADGSNNRLPLPLKLTRAQTFAAADKSTSHKHGPRATSMAVTDRAIIEQHVQIFHQEPKKMVDQLQKLQKEDIIQAIAAYFEGDVQFRKLGAKKTHDTQGNTEIEGMIPRQISPASEELLKAVDEKILSQINFPKAYDLARIKSKKTILWRHIKGVKESGIIEKMTGKELDVQEGKFELMLSEANYLVQMKILELHFMKNTKKHMEDGILTKKDFQIIFKYVPEINSISTEFLEALDSVWQKDMMLDDIYDVVTNYANGPFEIYVDYMRSLSASKDHVEELFQKNEYFKDLVEFMRMQPIACNLSLENYLTTPLSRVTKIPLLLQTILKHLPTETTEAWKCKIALQNMQRVTHRCDKVSDILKNAEHLLELDSKITFEPETIKIPIVQSRRIIITENDVQCYDEEKKKMFNRHVVLLNDLLLIGRQNKRDITGKITVLDYGYLLDCIPVYDPPNNKITINILHNSLKTSSKLTLEFSNGNEFKTWRNYLDSYKNAN